MTRDATTAFARTLVDEWVRCGVTHAVIAPGSRSAPLAYAIVEDGRLTTHVMLDERAAGFLAVGLGRATGRPAVVLTTSGTAGANLHPAMLEAHHGNVALLVCTADRPPEVRGTGAPQTIDQVGLFGGAVRWFVDADVPTDIPGAGPAWRALAARSVAEACGGALGASPGPVHLNLPFREPLVPTGDPLVDAPGRPDGAPWTPLPAHLDRELDEAVMDALADRIRTAPHGLLIAGWGSAVRPETAARFSRAAGWPIVADPLSGLGAADGAIVRYEALARAELFAQHHEPRLALRVGGPTTSSTLIRWLDAIGTETILIDPSPRWGAAVYGASSVIAAAPEQFLASLTDRLEARGEHREAGWAADWVAADRRAREVIDTVVDRWSECSEPRTARDVVDALTPGSTLVVASSMPVREVEWCARPRADIRVVANRGVNGIDGFVSTALGVALGSTGPVVALTGDLSFLHDGGGRLAARGLGVDIVFVVLDNDGGGIFSFLPQADYPSDFERLFGTPPGVDLAAIANAHGFSVETVHAPGDLVSTVARAVAAGGPAVVIVRTDRARNVEHHREVWEAVAQNLSER